MDEEWDLNDLYSFPHAYAQAYAFAYCFDTELSSHSVERINIALEGYPWQGGFSYVNIYHVLQNQVPWEHRPRINSIQYASPGWMELALHLDPAVKIAASVAAIAGSMATVAGAYAGVVKAYEAIQGSLYRLNRLRREAKNQDLKASHAHAQELIRFGNELANSLGFGSYDKLLERTQNPETAAKLISAQYRKYEILADYVLQGKAQLPISINIKKDR